MNPYDKTELTQVVPFLASILRPDIYLELGLFRGTTIQQVIPFVKRALGVDVNDQYLQCKTGYEFYHMTTDVFFDKVSKKEIILPYVDMVFIDACHSAEASLRDFQNVFPYVVDHGMILLHDTFPTNVSNLKLTVCGEVYRTAKEIRKRTDCEIVTLPCYPGLSLVRKCTKQTRLPQEA